MQTAPLHHTTASRLARAETRRQSRRRNATQRALLGLAVLAALLGVREVISRAAPTERPPDIASATVPGEALGQDAGGSQGSTTQIARAGVAPAAVPAESLASAQPRRPATITVSAVGDMIFDRRVKALIQSKGGKAPLVNVAPLLRRADVTVGNLESNLSRSGAPWPGKDVHFRGDPRGIEGLKASGFDFVALGNNHVLDYGKTSLLDTLSTLDRAGIAHSGAGKDRAAAWKPAVVTRDGATVAFLSFSHILPAGFVATGSRAGLAAGRGNMDAVASAIKAAKQRYDYVLVSFHWGVEYKDFANGDQVRDARRAVNAGADMVLSHHPHVIQGVEFYKGKLIAYSLGDFVFDHYSRKTGEAFILDAKLGPKGVRDVVATPVYLDGNGAPAVVTGQAASVILKRLRQISVQHGAKVTIVGSKAKISP